MTVDAYRASGEIEGAVAKTAEEVFAALSDGRWADAARHPPPARRGIRGRCGDLRRVERTLVAIDDAHAKIVDGWSMHACSRPMRSPFSCRTKRSRGSGPG